jgi:Fe-S-cluster containining protein
MKNQLIKGIANHLKRAKWLLLHDVTATQNNVPKYHFEDYDMMELLHVDNECYLFKGWNGNECRIFYARPL